MRHFAFCLLLLVLAGCSDREPLAPAFAGEWASRTRGCGGAPRITINKSGISAPGMPVDGLSFTQATVSGATAHVVMEMSAGARLVAGSTASKSSRRGDDPQDVEILATPIASGRLVNATNVMFRDKQTRQLKAADPNVLAIMSLTRCDKGEAPRSFGTAGLSRAGQ